MHTLPAYSSLFSTIYDEQNPVGHLGRGTHYSVFRSVEWMDVTREPLLTAQIHDFAVVWDEDHDTRVIEAIEKIYMAGLLSPIQFIGERKGMLTILVASKYFNLSEGDQFDRYSSELSQIAGSLGDSWPCEIGTFDRSTILDHQFEPHGLIAADDYRTRIYLKNIDSLWALGTKDFQFDT